MIQVSLWDAARRTMAILSGDFNSCGRLPVSIPLEVEKDDET
jgi:hypothetical protein